MIIIGMDISLSSTSVTIYKNNIEYILCYLNEDKTNKWAEMLSIIPYIKIKRVKKSKKVDNYSQNEMEKLSDYDKLSDLIISDIKNICGNNLCEIRIEGYSYTKNTNSIIDIVGLSTLIRSKLINNLNCNIKIISPNTLKLQTCKYTYGITEIKRIHKTTKRELNPIIKIINNDGISGGSFTKFEIYQSIIDGNIETIIFDFLLKNKNDIFDMKKIPSPIDDINDSLMLSKIII